MLSENLSKNNYLSSGVQKNVTGDSDEQLMQAVAGGDLDAFNEIVLRYQQQAWRTAYRLLGDAMEAEDVAQESFLKILKAAPRYRPTASFRSYLYTSIYRLCLDTRKKNRPTPGDAIPDRPSPLPSAMENMVSRERGEEIRHALNRLPLNQRTAMVLKHDQGLSYAEIAQVMDTTPKSVEMLIRRARKSLHAKLSHLNIHES
jgi:RNA polymerase sigma-70 factor (ECF subfamily)